MEVVKAKDLYFQPRVDNLSNELKKCIKKLNEISYEIDRYLDSEMIDIFQLNVMMDHRKILRETKTAIQNRIQRIRLETLN